MLVRTGEIAISQGAAAIKSFAMTCSLPLLCSELHYSVLLHVFYAVLVGLVTQLGQVDTCESKENFLP